MTPTTPLDAEATALRTRELVRRRLLPHTKLDEALDLVSGPEDVPRTVRSLLAIVGVVLVAAGVVFFVAANWSALAALGRMALVAVGIAGCVVTALHFGLRNAGGHAAVTLAALLVGPLLMLYGQTYQTGADAWELFFGWTLLLLPFAVVARFFGLYFLALLLVHVTVPLFMVQELGFDADDDSIFAAGLVLVVIDALALVAAELMLRRLRVAARGGPRAIAFLGALTALGGGCAAIVESHANDALRLAALASAGALAAFLTTSSKLLRRRTDLFFVALGMFLFAALALVALGRLLFDVLDLETGGLFIEGFLVLAVVGTLTRLLLHLHREGGHAAEEEP